MNKNALFENESPNRAMFVINLKVGSNKCSMLCYLLIMLIFNVNNA